MVARKMTRLTMLFIAALVFSTVSLHAYAADVIKPPLSTRGAKIIDAQGRTVVLRGVSWFGMETNTHVPHGLWARGYKETLAHIRSLGFNLIRLPFSIQAIKSDKISAVALAKGDNKQFEGKTPLEVMDLVIREAARHDLMILLDCHRIDDAKIPELWYDDNVSEADWIETWKMLAARYRRQANVIGADLKNEPHGRASWGTGDRATDWRLAAERAGNAIHRVHPDWLIVVEGVEKNVPGQQLKVHWWAGNLEGVRKFPVRLSVKNKLVYSPHEYGPGVHNSAWFSAANFPQNLDARWEKGFHYIAKENIAPILVGEFGGRKADATSKEGIWQRRFVDFLHDNQVSFVYWCWNPNSGDTGGLVKNDWKTPEREQLQLLSKLLSSPPPSKPRPRTLPVSQSVAKRKPVPSTAKQRTAAKLVKEVFQAEFLKARTPAGKRDVALAMIKAADQTNDSTEQYVLLRIARDVAAGAGEAGAAIAAVERLGETFELDVLKMKQTALLTAASAATTKQQRAEASELLVEVAREAIDAGRVEIAVLLAPLATTVAQKSRDKDQITAAAELEKLVNGRAKIYKEYLAAEAVLARNADDPVANRLVGRYRCLIRGDWKGGLPLLVRGEVGALQALAKQELANPTDASQQGALADGWWRVAATETGILQARMKARAGHWYTQALPKLSGGLAKIKAKKRLAELGLSFGTGGVPAPKRITNPRASGRPRVARDGPLRVLYKQGDQATDDNQIKPHLKLLNTGRSPVSLADVTLRYWFTNDGDRPQKLWVDYAKLDNKNISGKFRRMAKPTATADTYLELRFSEATAPVKPGADSGVIQLRIAKEGWTKFNDANDHSFGGGEAGGEFQEFDRITLYHKGKLVWGVEPGARQKQ